MSVIAKHQEQDGAEGYGGIHVVGGILNAQRTKHAISHTQLQLQHKILKLSEQLKMEQNARHDNVVEYLKLVNTNSNKEQRSQAFEKQNQASAQTIQQLQRRLEKNHCKLRMVEQDGVPRHPKDMFQGVHQGLKDVGAKVTGGLSTFSHSAAGAVVSKRREIASLIKKKFERVGCQHSSKGDCTSAAFSSAGASTAEAPGDPPRSKGNTTFENGQSSGFDALLREIQQLRDNQCRLEVSFENQKSHYERDYTMMLEAMQEDRCRCERDLKLKKEKEIHNLTRDLKVENEILNLKQELGSMEKQLDNLKQELASMEEKANNQCNLQAKVNRKVLEASEKTKKQYQQQALQLEALENTTFWNSLGDKVLLAVLYLLAFVYWVVVWVNKGRKPLMKTRSRAISTLVVLVTLAIWWNLNAISQCLNFYLVHPG